MTAVEAFLWPEVAPVLLLAPFVWLVLSALDRGRRQRLAVLLGPRAPALARDASRGRRRARRTLFATGLLLALIAVAQPVWGESTRTQDHRGVDVLVCLDVSRSMLAQDEQPSRLEAARREILVLAERARGDRLGLVAFAGEAQLTVPLTLDIDSFVQLVDRASPLTVARGGTDLGAALETALGALGAGAGEHEVVLLLTDGEDNEERGLRIAEECAARGVTVHCVGFGSARGSKIPIDGAALGGPSRERFLRDASGREVVSALDPSSLRRVAEATGGVYVAAGESPEPLVHVYEERVLPMARKAFAAESRRERENRFQWPLVAAFGLWILELCLTDRKR